MINFKLLEEAQTVINQQPKLIEISNADQLVFVGDTHGDLLASQTVIDRYLKPRNVIVFIGDYVDRGPQSKANVDTLMRYKIEHPNSLYLLQGNHENWPHVKFFPANFWERLDDEELEVYGKLLDSLPYAATSSNGIIALHAALPAVESLTEINDIHFGHEGWRQILWGDYQNRPGQFLADLGNRPQFGSDRFKTLMERFGMNVLIRGHQPPAPKLLYDDRCITIICSSSHSDRPREIVVADLNHNVQSAHDVDIVEI